METHRLYEFLTLSRTLNYSKAAEALFISQSALSKHIAELEKELGLSLFERDNHSVRLTAAGQVLSEEVFDFIEKCNSLEIMLKIRNLSTTGKLKIAFSLEFSYASHIQIFISQFVQRYPDIEVQMEVVGTSIVPGTLDHCDILFAPCEFVNLAPNIRRELVRSHTTYAALYQGHPLLSKASVNLSDLAGETLFVPFSNELFGPYAQNWILTKKVTHDRITAISVPNLPTAMMEVALGRGIAIVPRYAQNAAANNLFYIPISHSACRFNEFIYYDNAKDNGAAKLFFEEFCNTHIHSLQGL